MNICLMTAPIFCISSNENLSPLAKLHGAQDGTTFDLMCGNLLSILSRPRGSSVVPQCVHGKIIRSCTSCVVMSHESTRWYALRKNTALPLFVFAYLLFLALAALFCVSVIFAHLSLLWSRPALRSEWHFLHSYPSPSFLDESFTKSAVVAGISILQRLQTFSPSADALRYTLFMKEYYHKCGFNQDGPHFELDRKVYP